MKWFALIKEVNSKKLFILELEKDPKTIKEAELRALQILKEEGDENFKLIGVFSECICYQRKAS